MAPPLLILKDVDLHFGAKVLFKNVSFSLQEGEHVCLVGRNGSGKTTLFKMILQDVLPDGGDVFLQPGTYVSHCGQEPDFTGYQSLKEFCAAGLRPEQLPYLVDALISDIGLKAHVHPSQASGGEKRRAALVRALVSAPDILLLDEPTNHLDLEGILWLEKTLCAFKGACIMISHDRRFLKNVSKATLWLDRGRVKRMNDSYENFDAWAQDIVAQEMREQQKLHKVIAQETLWSHQGITARRKRNQGRLRRLYEMRDRKASHMAQTGRAKLSLKEGEIPSQLVIEAKSITKSFGDRKIFKAFSTRILAGDRLGIVGPNGCGKSTLVNTLLGHIKPDQGHVRLGKNLTPLYFDQNKEKLDPQKTLWQTLAVAGTDQVMVQGRPRHVVAYLKDFLFDIDQARSPVFSLSGGEKSRLLLAKYLAKSCNFLILDEPTNDLDMDTMDLLLDILSDFQGTIIVISHDRDFIDQLVTSTLVFVDECVIEVAGGYTEAVAYAKKISQNGQGGLTPVALQEKKKEIPEPARSIKTEKNRLSYHEERALKVLPEDIQTLEAQLRETTVRLEDPTLYEKDQGLFYDLTQACERLHKEIEEKEELWLSLEEKRLAFQEKESP